MTGTYVNFLRGFPLAWYCESPQYVQDVALE
jgi:hypothetical protein